MINWVELFDMQRELDARIIREKGLEGTDTIPWRVVSFLVELSEFANEARFFKMWSNDRKPRREKVLPGTYQDENGEWKQYTKDPLLEEFVDALHFAIGIGLELEQPTFAPAPYMSFQCDDASISYLNVTELACRIDSSWRDCNEKSCIRWWGNMFGYLLALGSMFGITDDEIVTAYKSKNAVNHQRQENGY